MREFFVKGLAACAITTASSLALFAGPESDSVRSKTSVHQQRRRKTHLHVDSDGSHREPTRRRGVGACRQILRHRRVDADSCWLQDHFRDGRAAWFGSSVGTEILVAKTEHAYTYAQAVKPDQPYNQYHGTLEARPVSPTSTKLIYTMFFDNSMLASDAAREEDKARKTAAFTRGLNNMKILAEGGTLPAPTAAGSTGGERK